MASPTPFQRCSCPPAQNPQNFLMMFRCDPGSRVRYAYFYAVRARQPKPAPFFHRGHGRHPPFPEMRHGTQRDTAPLGVCFNALSSKFAATCCTFW